MGDIATSYSPHESFLGGTCLFDSENSSPYFCESDHLRVKFGTLDNVVVIGRSVVCWREGVEMGGGGGGGLDMITICRLAALVSAGLHTTQAVLFY